MVWAVTVENSPVRAAAGTEHLVQSDLNVAGLPKGSVPSNTQVTNQGAFPKDQIIASATTLKGGQ